MKKAISVLKKIVPELIDLSEKRYTILRSILYLQPIGRRSLAVHLNCGERMVRSEVEFLKSQGLIAVEPMGMMVTPEGEEILEGLKGLIYYLKGLSGLEERLKRGLQVQQVYIIPGDVEENVLLLKEMGRVAASHIVNILRDNYIMAVTGGSTMAEVANAMMRSYSARNIMVVPARGGMGRDVEKQANTVASIFAKKLGGHYRLLHVPDNVGPEALDTLLQEPDIQNILNYLRNANILVHGIGKAQEMAGRRNLSKELMAMLEEKKAVAEAFGYYFNLEGQIVYKTSSIGVDIKDLDRIGTIMAVAGGKSKADAITAVMAQHRHTILVTDEGAAKAIAEKLPE